jgi:hypothetical protein
VKNAPLRILPGLIPAVAFFVLNAVAVIFIGCPGMGRVAP